MRKLRAPDGENPAAPKSMVAFGEVGDVGRVGDPNAPTEADVCSAKAPLDGAKVVGGGSMA